MAETAPAGLAMIMTICHDHIAPAGRAPSSVRLSVSVNVCVCVCVCDLAGNRGCQRCRGGVALHCTLVDLIDIARDNSKQTDTATKAHTRRQTRLRVPVAFLCHSDEYVVPLKRVSK